MMNATLSAPEAFGNDPDEGGLKRRFARTSRTLVSAFGNDPDEGGLKRLVPANSTPIHLAFGNDPDEGGLKPDAVVLGEEAGHRFRE